MDQVKEELICSLFYEYYTENVAFLHEESFEEDMVSEVAALLSEQQDVVDFEPDDLYAALELFRLMVPLRTSQWVAPREAPLPVYELPPYAQRSPEWYEYRHNMITASSVYKTLGTPSELNSLVVEKCSPPTSHASTSTVGPRHWGVRYEPVSVQYYEWKYSTKVSDFACLPHRAHPFLGASPDGVNTLPGAAVYGRMLEIKNPFSRVITGEPKREYWAQMQVQMEVMDLDVCDLLETQFVEYPNRAAFESDGATFSITEGGKPKGALLYFQRNEMYEYAYAPFQCSQAEFDEWEQAELAKDATRHWVTTVYWKLENAVCTIVPRNSAWFLANLPMFQTAWQTIVEERVSGAWSARLPVPRKTKMDVTP